MLATTQTPLVSYEAIQKAARIIKYVYQFYFPLHGLDSKEIFNYYPVFTSVEALIYQADVIMEAGQNAKITSRQNEDLHKSIKQLQMNCLKLLKDLDLYDSKIEQEIALGEEFIKLENKIMVGGVIKHSEVMRIAELRSSDIRLLHLILFRLLEKPYDEKLLSLVWPIEVIADIEDDFKGYVDDVAQNHYNTYRMFVTLYKENAPEYIKAEIDFYENLFQERLANFPIDMQQKFLALYSQFRQSNYFAIPKPILE
ncbi:hypothetical protein NUACC21_07510 [Scytonema sp. NUACC21]